MTSAPLTLADLGEFGAIARIREWLDSAEGNPADASVRIGPGDDVAIAKPPEGRELLLTCDVQLAGRHFIPAWMTAKEVGRRALEVSLSDIAAKGGEVLWVLASLGLPPHFRIDHLEQVYQGVLEGLRGAGSGTVVGGNLTSCAREHWFLDLTVIGNAPIGRAAVRSGAQSGDLVFVTGHPGSSAAGLELLRARSGGTESGELGSRLDLRNDLLTSGAPFARWVESLVQPRARLAFGQALVSSGHVHAILDVSDGILGDLFHLCESSQVSSSLELASLSFPAYDSATLGRLGVETENAPWRWILGPSDDYELLFTTPLSARSEILELGRKHDTPVREVGVIMSGEPTIEVRGEKTGISDHLWTPGASAGGWDHFGSSDRTS